MILLRYLIIFNLFISSIAFAVPDLRFVMDASANILAQDTKSLSYSAISNLAKMLPDGVIAGIWECDSDIRELIPTKVVDRAWRSNIDKLSFSKTTQIKYSNLAVALQKIALHWNTTRVAKDKRSIILFTDGIVGDNADEMLNDEIKANILDTIIPIIKAKKVVLYVVSSSKTADLKFLQAIVDATDGMLLSIDKDNFHMTILKLFNKMVGKEHIPLKSNAFEVADKIEELILLAEHNNSEFIPYIIDNMGNMHQKTKLPDNIAWVSSGNLELISIKQPKAGVWEYVGNFDNTSNTLIYPDLTLDMSELPEKIFKGEDFNIDVSLLSHGKPIIHKDFLSFVTINAILDYGDGSKKEFPLYDDGRGIDLKSKDGIYTLRITQFVSDKNDIAQFINKFKSHTEHRASLQVVAASDVFKRIKTSNITVLDIPVRVDPVIVVNKKSDAHITLNFSPDTSIFKLEDLKVKVVYNNKEETNMKDYDVIKLNGLYKIDLTVPKNVEEVFVTIKISGRAFGRKINIEAKPLTITMPTINLDAVKEEVSAAVSAAYKNKVNIEKQKTEEFKNQVEDLQTQIALHKAEESMSIKNAIILAHVILLINLIVISVGIGAYLLINNYFSKTQHNILKKFEAKA